MLFKERDFALADHANIVEKILEGEHKTLCIITNNYNCLLYPAFMKLIELGYLRQEPNRFITLKRFELYHDGMNIDNIKDIILMKVASAAFSPGDIILTYTSNNYVHLEKAVTQTSVKRF